MTDMPNLEEVKWKIVHVQKSLKEDRLYVHIEFEKIPGTKEVYSGTYKFKLENNQIKEYDENDKMAVKLVKKLRLRLLTGIY